VTYDPDLYGPPEHDPSDDDPGDDDELWAAAAREQAEWEAAGDD
jgi:hypothetical protein